MPSARKGLGSIPGTTKNISLILAQHMKINSRCTVDLKVSKVSGRAMSSTRLQQKCPINSVLYGNDKLHVATEYLKCI